MKWQYCNSKGVISSRPEGFQIDTVGNIVQESGGVNPKACQKCKVEFKSKPIQKPIKQDISIYKCRNCDFESSNPNDVLDHKLEKENHKIKKKKKERIVGYNTILEGTLSQITKTDDDIEILCSGCYGK